MKYLVLIPDGMADRKMRELGGLRGIDLGQPGAVAPFAELLREATAADTGELEQNALATLRDYASFRLSRDDDAPAWEPGRRRRG